MADEALLRYAFAREPGPPPVPRAGVYRELVRTNLRQVLTNSLPVTRELLGDRGFDELMAAFLDAGGPGTSFYREVPGELVAWAVETDQADADLMHWEWLELVAARHPADLDGLEPSRDGLVRPNPTLQPGIYTRPVHRIRADEPSPEPFETPQVYLVWRRPRTDAVAFHRVGRLLARAIAHASVEPATVEALADRVADEAGGAVSAVEVHRALEPTVAELRDRDGIL